MPLAIAAMSCLVTLLGTVLLLVNGQSLLHGFNLALIVTGVGFAIAGGLVTTRVPGNLLGPLFLVTASLWAADLLFNQYGWYGFYTAPGTVPLLGLAVWLSGWIWVPGTGLVLFATPVLFPDGRLPSPRWRPAAAFMAFTVATATIGHAAVTWQVRDTAISLQPAYIASEVPGLAGRITELGDTLQLPAAILAATALVLRYRRSTGIVRLQMRWYTAAIVAAIACTVASSAFSDVAPGLTALAGVALGLVPAAMVFAILRYRLFEIDRIVSRTIGWAVVTGIIVALFAVAIVGLDGLLAGITQGQTLAVAASTLAAASLVQPVRRRVQGSVDRRFDRARYDGERLVGEFAAGLRSEADLARIRSGILATAASAVRPEHAALWLRGGRP